MCAPAAEQRHDSLFPGPVRELLQQPRLTYARLPAHDDHACLCLIAPRELIEHALDHSFPADKGAAGSPGGRRERYLDPVTTSIDR